MERGRRVEIAMDERQAVQMLSHKEIMLVMKFRQARRLAQEGHRSRLEIMFYDDGRSCDITIEDRERVVEKMVDHDMK